MENSNVISVTLLSWVVFPWKDRMQWFLEPQSFLKSMTWMPQNHNISKMVHPDNPEVVSSYSFHIYAKNHIN